MSDRIVYVDRSSVREGRITELKRAARQLADFVEANEPQLGGYRVYFDEDGTHMTVIHEHASSASLDLHMETAAPLFPKFVDLVRLLTIDIYGKPGDGLLQELRRKASLLGPAKVTVHDLHAGFVRPEPPNSFSR